MRLTPPPSRLPVTPDTSWRIVLEASALAARLDREGRPAVFGLGAAPALVEIDDGAAEAVMAWAPGTGWQSRLPAGDPRAEFVDLYLPLCSATLARPLTLGHLGQSLDGFIATETGDSQFVTGAGNLAHMHRLRALSDAVVVGAGTVVADDPRLTTRLVEGPNPLRVVFDPARRVAASARVFTDGAAPTLYACGRPRLRDGETHVGHAEILPVPGEGHDAARALLSALRARGCARVFVEGGGVTVSAFLEAGLLDRLQIAVAPVLIGQGRPAVRLAPRASLRDCRRPAYRVFRMGGDVLFDCDLRSPSSDDDDPAAPAVTRVI